MRTVGIPGTTPATTGSPLTGRSDYVAVENPGGLAIVDNETGAVVSELAYPVGNRPHGVFLSPRRWGCSAITLGSSGWRSALPVLTVAPDSHVVGRRSSSAMPFNETSAPLAEVSNSGPLLRSDFALPSRFTAFLLVSMSRASRDRYCAPAPAFHAPSTRAEASHGARDDLVAGRLT